MWHSRANRDRNRIVCIICDDAVPQPTTRRYDKEGNRWKQCSKRLEHLYKLCYRGLCHQPRKKLEGLPDDIEERGTSDEEFLLRYFDAVKGRYELSGERGR